MNSKIFIFFTSHLKTDDMLLQVGFYVLITSSTYGHKQHRSQDKLLQMNILISTNFNNLALPIQLQIHSLILLRVIPELE